ncbi:leucine-rich repeat domain-containing protein, partial [Salmonella enterica]|uniref:leucine-rich repeat domain-containing protein n=1 Tax=Salmonella enterica TaxID=28901 RepID=UPI0022B69B1B
LPTLPPEVKFEHVRQLSLRNMGLNDDVGYFLKHFKGLNTLELTDNQVTRLPEVLQQMKHLRRLYLANNQLQLTEYTRTKLGDLRGLTVLDLTNNP